MINEVLYCERLMYLEWSQGEFEDNAFTVEGRVVTHANVDRRAQRSRSRRTSDAPDDEDGTPQEPPPYNARSVWLSSEELGITAKIDFIEEGEAGSLVPVEYKRGSVPDVPERAYLPERAQVCAQALLLRKNGYRCLEGSIYFAKDRRRVPVVLDDELIATTLRAVMRARELASAGMLPAPLENSPKCQGCSLVGICLPDETTLLGRDDEAYERLKSSPLAPSGEGMRRLHPARDDRLPLYVQAHGAYVSLDGERLVTKTKQNVTEARLPNTSQVCLLGNVQISTPAVRALLERSIPLLYFTYGGWFLGRTFGHDTKNIELRIAQHSRLRDSTTCLDLARTIVESKILNCRTMLRRNADPPDAVALFELKQLARKASEAPSLESLLGVEGTAARTYFGSFGSMLKGGTEGRFDFDGRNRRPPKDPLNALLSLAYAMLVKDVSLALSAAGLEPLLGFYHQPRFGRPALALDLMEEFRPLIADSVALSAINTGVVGDGDFLRAAGACALKADARKRFILAYERRMDHLITHPLFGYRISYRRVLEVQARLFGRCILGEIDRYPAFRTR